MYFGKRILASAIRRARSSSVRFSSGGSTGVLGDDDFSVLLGEGEVVTTSGASCNWEFAVGESIFAASCWSMAKLSMMGKVRYRQRGYVAPFIWKAFATHPILSSFATHCT